MVANRPADLATAVRSWRDSARTVGVLDDGDVRITVVIVGSVLELRQSDNDAPAELTDTIFLDAADLAWLLPLLGRLVPQLSEEP